MLVLLLGLAFTGLGYRLVDLQVLRHAELKAKAQQNTQREFRFEPRRGDILDVKGNLLATSVFVKTVCADPVLLGNHQVEVARAVAPLLQVNEAELCQRLLPRLRRNERGETVTNRYVVLKHKVPVETWQKLQQAMAQLPLAADEKNLSKLERASHRALRQQGVFADPIDDQLRVYPNQGLAAHLLGYVGVEARDGSGSPLLETAGREGIEFTLNTKLSGARGWRVTETDQRRRELVALREQDVEPRDGLNVVLTIDSVMQHIVEGALAEAMEKHAPVSASCVVVRPRTGEILAMATLPDFDPNQPGAVPADARRNRVICDVAEPGSTFKVVVVAGALNEQSVRLTDAFDCERGHFVYAGKVLRDHESYGVLTVENIITKSSNIGAAKIGIKMGAASVCQYVRDFGFGTRTGIPLLGEVGGIVHPLKDWNKLSISRIPMGHEVAVTPIQMVMAVAAIANHGSLMRPMLVARLEDRQGNVVAKYAPQRVRQVITEATAKQMVQALKIVVSAEGTAPKAALEHYTVAGKTGTAQKAGLGGYLPGKYFSSFVGFFPADAPELCIYVALDEPKQGYYGGQTAAPIFKQIAERAANYLNVYPDNGPVSPEAVVAEKTDPAMKTAVALQNERTRHD